VEKTGLEFGMPVALPALRPNYCGLHGNGRSNAMPTGLAAVN